MIRNHLSFFILLFMSPFTAYSQHTFNVVDGATNTRYLVTVDLSNRTVSAGSGFCVTFYQAKVLDGGIAFALRQNQEPSLKPNTEDWFFCIKPTSLGFYNPNDIIFVKGDPIDYSAYTQAYNQLSKAIKKAVITSAPTTPAPSSASSGSNRTFIVNGVSFTMVYVQGGTFTMGATTEQESEADDDEKPAHRVTLSSFSIGQTEVTQELWRAVMGDNPSKYQKSEDSVESVSWYDCQRFISRLNSLTGQSFRMPTEAEWEYAARGGNQSRGYKYSGSNTSMGWYEIKSGSNELGIYDMSWNVWEWCSDRYSENYYAHSPTSNPQGSSLGSYRVLRGGRWDIYDRSCRVADRDLRAPDYRNDHLGLRLVL